MYFHLRDHFNLEKTHIPRRLKDFSNALERIFGLGVMYLEIRIIKNIYFKMGLAVNPTKHVIIAPDTTFEENVLPARQLFESKRKTRNNKNALQFCIQTQQADAPTLRK